MKALILGGSGKTGQLLRGLIDSKAPSRAECDVTSSASLQKALEGCDAVVVVLSPRTRNDPLRSRCATALVDAMKSKGVARVVWVSSSGVGDSLEGAAKTSFVFAKIIIPLFMKAVIADAGRAEETLRHSGLDYTVVRPMQLVDAERPGDATAVAPSEKCASAKISRAQLARFIARELTARAWVGKLPVLYG